MKTAVEFLVNEINKLTGLTISMDEPCVEQANELFKNQIRDAFNAGDLDSSSYFIPFLKESDESEQYYKENYESKTNI